MGVIISVGLAREFTRKSETDSICIVFWAVHADR